MARFTKSAVALSVALGLAASMAPGHAQDVVVQASPAPAGAMPDLSKMPPEVRARIEAQMKARGMPVPGQPQPGGDAKPGEEKKPGEGEKPKDEAAPTIKRPTTPPTANPDELKAKPDKDGMVQFNFRGQPWTEVMQWFADVSNSSLDWQELPADYLNLTTTRRHTIAETRDMLNRHLLARGFTMLAQGDVLTVVKIDKIDPSLVPLVDQDELEDHAPYEFAKARFDVPESMDVAKAAEDVKLLVSPAGKVTPLLASKRLLVIDAVANLRGVRSLLYDEESAVASDVRPRIFPIRYRRAEYVADQIMIVLGLDVKKRQSPQEMMMEQQAEQQRMQMMQQMAQRGGGDGNAAAMAKKEPPEVHIAVDRRRNVLLVNAPPKELAIIERTIKEVDVPTAGSEPSAEASGGLSLEKYQVLTADPETVVTALKEVGNLSPLTQLQSDNASKTIFAYATAEDHATIKRMMDKLDASGRSLRVVWLNRRAAADQVAGTIYALMVGTEEKKDDNNNGRGFIFFNPFGNRDEKKNESKFRIQADVENNRLLLWANEAEFKEVNTLLEKLGATSVVGRGGGPARWRVMEARTPEETARLLQQLQSSWAGKNKLEIHVPPQAAPDAVKSPEQPPADEKEKPPENLDKVTLLPNGAPLARPIFRLVEFAEPKADVPATKTPAAADEPASKTDQPAPPIQVTVTSDGRIVLSSDDVAALDQIEDLLAELEPPRREFEVFPLHNSRASLVVLNLEEYFEEELKGATESVFNMWGEYSGTRDKAAGASTLAKRPPLRFIWDGDTNTIVAQNASPSQLAVIRKLIAIYDQPVGEDAVAKRITKVIPIRYSKASVIAASLKEVYRDLLSSKDKEFQGGKQGEQKTRTETYFRFFGGSGDNDKNKKSAPVKMAFEGALSVGVDDVSNTLIISAEENVWASVYQIVKDLDEKAKPDTTVAVHELRGGVRASELQKVLEAALSKPWPGGKPETAGAQQNNGGRNGGDNNGGDNNRGRRGRGRGGSND